MAAGRKPLLLALNASPRRRGNSARLLTSFISGLSGWSVKRVFLCDLNLSPCRSCYRCRTTYRCRQPDDGEKLLHLFDRASAVVLAWWGTNVSGGADCAAAVLERI